jgi:predicted DNA-binding protein
MSIDIRKYIDEIESKNNNIIKIKIADRTANQIKNLSKQNIPIKNMIEEMIENYINDVYEKNND